MAECNCEGKQKQKVYSPEVKSRRYKKKFPFQKYSLLTHEAQVQIQTKSL
jgi:hypothetical protein